LAEQRRDGLPMALFHGQQQGGLPVGIGGIDIHLPGQDRDQTLDIALGGSPA
jgi:hypothetical protein